MIVLGAVCALCGVVTFTFALWGAFEELKVDRD